MAPGKPQPDWPWIVAAIAVGVAIVIAGALAVHAAQAAPFRQCGVASWYSYTGHRTASGRLFTGREMTAAHRTLPFGTRVLVTDKANGRSVVVVIDDRGPAAWTNRVIDLSRAAAQAIGMPGTAPVCLTLLR